MKKFKHFLFALLTVAMICALALVTACSSCNSDDEDEEQPAAPVLQSIVLNTDSVKTEFEGGEVFVYRGLIVTAKYDKGDDKVVTNKAVVDSSEFNNKVDGTYEIKVSYTEGEITKTASYNVKVNVAMLTSIEINTEAVKKAYYNTDEFDPSGIVVTAKYDKKGDSNVTDLVEYDTSDYDNTQAGTYTIVVSYTENGVTESQSFEVTVEMRTLESITATGGKTSFGGSDEFDTTGLVVMAHFDKGDDKDVTKLIEVDSSEFNSMANGTYTIEISYTEAGVTKTDSYEVTVLMIADGTGLDVQLAEGVANIIRLSSTTPTASIDTSKVVVKSVTADGKIRKVLEANEYTAELYLGQNKLSSTTGLSEGVYQIVVSMPYYADETNILWAFVPVYVVNSLDSLTFNSTAAGTLTEQEAGAEKLSATWTYTATFADGTTRNITSTDVTVGTMDTRTVGEHTVTVTYKTVNFLGEEETATVDVTYTITEKTTTGGPASHSYSLIADGNITASITDEYVWLKEDDDGNKVSIIASTANTVTVDSNSKSMDNISFTHRVKLGGQGTTEYRSVKLVLATDTEITIYAMSSSSKAGDERTVRLLDDSGSAVSLNAIAKLDGKEFTDTTTVDGASLHKIVIKVSAGTYYFGSKSGGFNVYGIKLEIG